MRPWPGRDKNPDIAAALERFIVAAGIAVIVGAMA